jgi:hypothetical protein
MDIRYGADRLHAGTATAMAPPGSPEAGKGKIDAR